MKTARVITFLAVIILGLSGCPTGHVPNQGSKTDPAKYAVEFRGEWIRMDTGDRWYINGNSIKVNGAVSSKNVTLARISDNVVTATDTNKVTYTLFAARVANASFNAQVIFLDENPTVKKISRDLIGDTGKMPPVRIINEEQPDIEIIVPPDDEGKVSFSGLIPGDPIKIIPDVSEWKDISVGITPGWGEDQNMGVIPHLTLIISKFQSAWPMLQRI